MTRRRPHPVLSSLVAASLLADATLCTRIAWHSTSLATWLGSAVLGYSAVLAAGYALGTVWYAAAHRACRRRDRRRYRPAGRPRPGTGMRPAAPVEGRHARAVAAVAAQPTLPAHDGQTQTMPVIDLAAFDYEYSGGAR